MFAGYSLRHAFGIAASADTKGADFMTYLLRGFIARMRTGRSTGASSSTQWPRKRTSSKCTNAAAPYPLPVSWDTDEPTPEHYAQQLLNWLKARGNAQPLLHHQMVAAYCEMCDETGLAPRPWNPIAAALARLTTGRKVYCWRRLSDGSRRRLRIYPLDSVVTPGQAAPEAGDPDVTHDPTSALPERTAA